MCGAVLLVARGRERRYDGRPKAFDFTVRWALPWLLGRTYFTDFESQRALALIIVVGALLYVPFALWEVKMSPQLHSQVYGVALRSFCEREEYPGPPPWPRITVEKRINGDDANLPPGPALPADAEIEWTFVVTNPSEVALVDVEVADDHGLLVTCPDDILSPGESMTCTATGLTAPGVHRNVATATGKTLNGWVVEDSDPAHYCCLVPGIDIEKLTQGEDADVPPGPSIVIGNQPVPVTWTYVVTNTGQQALTDVTVTDDQGVEVVCPKDSLEVGESMTCVAMKAKSQ